MFKCRKKCSVKALKKSAFSNSKSSPKRSLKRRVGTAKRRNKMPPPPEDSMSFETGHSTPQAKGNHMNIKTKASTDRDNASRRFDRRMGNTNRPKDSFPLPFSIDFLSLLLPSESPHFTGSSTSSTVPVSAIEDKDTAIASEAFSGISVQTTKDRVQETISSSVNVEYFFSSSPLSADICTSFDDVPVNVDFVLESTEDELAVFAKSCIRSRRYRDTIDIYESVLDHYRQQSKDHRLVISALHNLGIVHTWNGNYSDALIYCNEALRIRRNKFGNGHLQVASSLQELGIIHYARENFNKALGAFRESLQILSKDPTPQGIESRIPSILNNIACIHFSMGKLEASLSTFEECLNLQRISMGSVCGSGVDRILFNISIVLTNAATIAAKQGNSCRAISLMEEGLIVQQSVLPDDHRAVMSVRKSLSHIEGIDHSLNLNQDSLQMKSGQPDQKEKTSQKIRDACVDVTNSPSPNFDLPEDMHFPCAEMLSLEPLKMTSNSQGRVQLNMNIERLPHALVTEGISKRHCSWVDISKDSVSNENKDFNFLEIAQKASKYIKRKEVQRATNLFETIKRSHKTKCGDVTYILGTISYMLGLIHLYTTEYDRALSHFRESYKIRISALDPDHIDVLASLTMVAITMLALKDYDGAQIKLEKVLRLTRKKHGYNDERVAVVLNNIALCHYELGGLLTSLKTFEETVEILRDATKRPIEATILIQITIMLGRSLNNLAYIRCKRKEYAEAIVALEEALKFQRRIFGDSHVVAKNTVESLAVCMAKANCDNEENKDKVKLDHMTEMYMEMLVS